MDTVSQLPFMLSSCLISHDQCDLRSSPLTLTTMAASSSPCSVRSPHLVWAPWPTHTPCSHFSQTALRACDHTLPFARRASSDQPFHSEGPSSYNLCDPPLSRLPYFHVSTHPTVGSPTIRGLFFLPPHFHKPHHRVHHSMVPCNKRGCFLFRSCHGA